MRKLFLYGPPASGKSTAAKALADNLGLAFIDLDQAIEQRAGTSIPLIMSAQGEAAFRELESLTLQAVVAGPAGVIALGGGALLRPENRE
ncbi:MAG TPA: shikimate kinase, partial [Polyangia bacterium]